MEYLDFGRYLSQQRELRGVSLAEVASSTRIPVTVLAALEEGEVEKLPARVFVINYVRAYANAIGLAEEEAVLRYEEVDRTAKVGLPPPALERQRRKRAWRGLVLASAGVAAVVYALSLLMGA